jgi:hypothetical protein
MGKRQADPMVAKLDEILTVLQDLVILEGQQAGLTRDTVRTILGVDRTRISSIWKHLKAARKDGGSA